MHVIVYFFSFFLGVAITQDYTEEFRDIAKGSKSKEALPAGSITLINQRPVGEDVHVKFCYVLHYQNSPAFYTYLSRHQRRFMHTRTHTHVYISTYAHKKGNRAYFFTDRQSRNNVETGKHDEVTEDGFPFSASGSPNLTELTVTRYALVLARNRRSISRIHAKHVSIIRCWSEFAMNWIDLIVKSFRLIFFY